jgi:hypothetical protein
MIGRTLIVPPDAWEVQEGACISIIAVSGFGGLLRPPSQPAFLLAEPGSQISVGSVPEPGNRMVEAGSATSEELGAIQRSPRRVAS